MFSTAQLSLPVFLINVVQDLDIVLRQSLSTLHGDLTEQIPSMFGRDNCVFGKTVGCSYAASFAANSKHVHFFFDLEDGKAQGDFSPILALLVTMPVVPS